VVTEDPKSIERGSRLRAVRAIRGYVLIKRNCRRVYIRIPQGNDLRTQQSYRLSVKTLRGVYYLRNLGTSEISYKRVSRLLEE